MFGFEKPLLSHGSHYLNDEVTSSDNVDSYLRCFSGSLSRITLPYDLILASHPNLLFRAHGDKYIHTKKNEAVLVGHKGSIQIILGSVSQ